MLADKIKISVGRLKNLRKNLSVGGSQCVSLSLFCAVRWSESVLFFRSRTRCSGEEDNLSGHY
jgi:hypothetical protein